MAHGSGGGGEHHKKKDVTVRPSRAMVVWSSSGFAFAS